MVRGRSRTADHERPFLPMTPLRSRALPRALGAVALVAASLAVATTASAPAAAATEPCTVDGATLDWGFKESFRAYIDGSIANGEWTTADGASYATPEFTWSDGTATIDDEADTAEVTFAGSVRFTGHDGLLDTTIANPVVRIAPDGTTTVLLDVSGPTMEGDPVDEKAVPFVTSLVDASVLAEEGAQTFQLVAPELTAEGSAAFPNYEAGTPFDNLTVTIPATEDCRVTAAPATDLFGVWILTAAVAVPIIIGLAVFQAILRRRKAKNDA